MSKDKKDKKTKKKATKDEKHKKTKKKATKDKKHKKTKKKVKKDKKHNELKKKVRKERNEYSQNTQKARKIGKVPKSNRLRFKKDSGVLFGLKKSLGKKKFVGKSEEEDGHIVNIGGPGSGKTEGPAKITFSTWGGRVIAVDIKGGSEGFDHFRSAFRRQRQVKVFNPTRPDAAHFDPLRLLKSGGEENLVRYARDIAQSILQITPDIGVNKVWTRLAQNLLTAAILYYYSIGADFNLTMLAVQKHSVTQLVDLIADSHDTVAAKELARGVLPSSDASCRELAKLFISKIEGLKSEVQAGIGMDFGEFIALAVDPLVQSAFDTSDEKADIIDWNDFLSDENDYDVILQIPEYMLEQWESMLTLMLTQLFRTLERRPEEHSVEALRPLLILLDEFPRLGKCDAVKNALATLRSRGVTFSLFIQCLAQLDERYGKDGRREILGCCSYKLLLGISDPDDQEYFSKEIGETSTVSSQIAVGYDARDDLMSRNFSFSEGRKRIVSPEELGYLKDKCILITPEGPCRIDKAFCSDPKLMERLKMYSKKYH